MVHPFFRYYRELPVPFHAIDRDGVIVAVSKAWLDLLGYDANEVIGKKSVDFLTEESAETANRIVPRFWEVGEVRDQPYRMCHKNGTEVSVLFSACIAEGPDGEPHSLCFIKESSNGIEAIEKRAQQVNHTMYALSHDLRKPARHLVSYAEAFVEDFEDCVGDEGRELLMRIRRAGFRLEAMIDGILQFAKAEIVPEWESIDVTTIFAEAIEDSSKEIEARNAIIMSRPSEPIAGSRPMIYQLISNLLINALKFNDKEQPKISLTSHRVGSFVFFHFDDNGPGIDVSHREAATLLFRRPGAHARGVEGLGVGLALCARIVDAHGGILRIKRSPQGGARITFSLPLDIFR